MRQVLVEPITERIRAYQLEKDETVYTGLDWYSSIAIGVPIYEQGKAGDWVVHHSRWKRVCTKEKFEKNFNIVGELTQETSCG